MALSTQNRERVTVSHTSLPAIEWSKASGGARNHTTTKVRTTAGGKKKPLSGDSGVENVTTEAFIDPVAHDALIAALHAGETYQGATVTRQFIDAAEVPIGSPRSYFDCSVAKFELSDADANAEDGATLIVEWIVGD